LPIDRPNAQKKAGSSASESESANKSNGGHYMQLFAQHGAQEGEKINEGLARGLLDGVIYSPRDVSLDTLRGRLDSLAAASERADRLIDPQYYAIFLNGTDEARLGNLLEDYGAYFQPRRRSQLERENQIRQDLAAALKFQTTLNVTGIIAPNIVIPNSLNSIEAVIAKNFIRLATGEYSKLSDKRNRPATPWGGRYLSCRCTSRADLLN
jgi:hypothetical protein